MILFIFRRDLRLIDNLGLRLALSLGKVMPVFIFTPEQITRNKFKSNNALQFMCESLENLDEALKKQNSKLHIFNGDNIKIIKKILKKIEISAIVTNKDYTPYALERDASIKKLCEEKKIDFYNPEDYLLNPMGKFLKKDETPYTVFTPFKNNALQYKIDNPKNYSLENLSKVKIKESKMIDYEINYNILVSGGRKRGLKKLKDAQKIKKYDTNRNNLSISTTQLSAYIKFGCLSIREVWHSLKDPTIRSQLIWREFYYYIAYYFPRVLKGKSFIEKYDAIKWNWSKDLYKAWCDGKTGYPVVDAGMRELNKTGYMHNRARLITSNFLNRILNLDWRWSELYYAQKLTDYDPSVNSGNHQWIASVGVDPKPYNQRLFNPWIQSYKFDPKCIYIKKWVPELKNIEPKKIHKWHKYADSSIYIKPIVDYAESRNISLAKYKDIKTHS